MRPIRIKFNSDRQDKFRIQTCICQDNGKKMIIKKALTEDAERHLNEMLLNQESIIAKQNEQDEILAELLLGQQKGV